MDFEDESNKFEESLNKFYEAAKELKEAYSEKSFTNPNYICININSDNCITIYPENELGCTHCFRGHASNLYEIKEGDSDGRD